MQEKSRSPQPEHIFLNNEQMFRGLVDSVPVGIYTTDHKGVITYYNEKAAEIWGRRPKINDITEALFCGSLKLFGPDGFPMAHDHSPMAVAIREQKSLKGKEICIERQDGTRVFAMANVDLIYTPQNSFVGAVNVLMDITDRKRFDADTNRLAAIVESSDDAIVSKDIYGIITSWNSGAEKIFGYKEEEVIGKSIHILIPPQRQDEEEEILSKIRKGQKVDHFETVRLTKAGEEIHISLTVSPIKNSRNEIIGASKIARNINERIKIQKELQEVNQKLVKLNKVKDEFLSLASHELKTPITVIKAHLELVKPADEPSEKMIRRGLTHVEKLSALVSDLLDVTRIEEGEMKLNFSLFDINELILECVEGIKMAESDFQIDINRRAGAANVKADRQRVEQVLFNLLTNAVKYSGQEKRVVVSSLRVDTNVIVHVTDYGIGIPADQLEKVFSRFYRVEGFSNQSSGVGIGLFISKEIIERHNGKIWVISRLGEGSTFSFSLPAA